MHNGNSTVKSRQQGFILLGMLCLVAIAGLALTQASAKYSEARAREREIELLKVGNAYRNAIGSYYNQTPGVVKHYPASLEDLLKDVRFASPRRHIRKLYQDPITQKLGWGMLEAPSGGVLGIYSLSDKKPFKTKNFRFINRHFENQKSYGEWFFAYVPQ